jgi:hypothetical protein
VQGIKQVEKVLGIDLALFSVVKEKYRNGEQRKIGDCAKRA